MIVLEHVFVLDHTNSLGLLHVESFQPLQPLLAAVTAPWSIASGVIPAARALARVCAQHALTGRCGVGVVREVEQGL